MRRVLGGALVVVLVVALTAGTAGAVNREKKRRPGPPRVLLLGDSLTFNSQTRTAALLGSGYQVLGAGAGGTGLLDVGVCKGERGAALANMFDPDIVVIEYLGNYKQTGTTPCNAAVQKDTKFFYRDWKLAAKATMKPFLARGAKVIWMLNPQSNRPSWSPVIPKINDIYRTIGKLPPIDAWTSFGGATYSPALHDPDGLHPNAAGYERLSEQVHYRVTHLAP